MEIAVCVYGHGPVVAQTEGHVGRFAGLEILSLTAVFGLQIDPLDVVLVGHRVIDAAYVDVHRAVRKDYDGQMLFGAGFNGVGRQFLHGLSAADNGNAGIIDLFDDITAGAADIEFRIH